MGHKTLVGGTAYDISGGKVVVGGTAYGIKKGRTLVDGTGHDISFIKTMNDLEIGTSVYLNVDGVSTKFIIVHQGNPDSSIYDDSCDGIWLLMKDVYSKRYFSYSSNDYAGSSIHSYLNGTFLGLLDSDIQDLVKQAKIPYWYDANYGVWDGSSGLSTKVFLLSGSEVGFDSTVTGGDYLPEDEGVCLSYFSGGSNAARIGYYNGTATSWWLRSPYTGGSTYTWCVYTQGASNWFDSSSSLGIRPALILPHDTVIDDNYNVVA